MNILKIGERYFFRMTAIPTCCLVASSVCLAILSSLLIGSNAAGKKLVFRLVHIRKPFERIIVIIFLLINLNMCFGRSKGPSH